MVFGSLFQNSVEHFYIYYDHPTRVYDLGETVKGTLVAQVNEAIKCRAVVLEFIGKAHTYWTETEYHHKLVLFCYIGYMKVYTFSYHYNYNDHCHDDGYEQVPYSAEIKYIHQICSVWVSVNDERLPAGTYRWPFSFTLPAVAPPSYEGWFFDGILFFSSSE